MNYEEVIAYCMTFKNVYQDLPFRDEKQIVICHRGNRKVFAWFYEKKGKSYVRFRCPEEQGKQWTETYEAVEKDNWEGKAKWVKVCLDEGLRLNEEALKVIATASYEITRPGEKRKSSSWYFK